MEKEKLSKRFYMGSIAGVGGLAVVFLVIANLMLLSANVSGGETPAGIVLLLIGLLLSIYGGIVAMILWYKAWETIQDGNARTTPGKAIGFLFIPIFNFYWIFQAFLGFSKDYNSYVKRHNISISPIPEGLFLTSCILTVVGFVINRIPVLGSMYALISFGIWIAVMNNVCNAVNNLVSFAPTIQQIQKQPQSPKTRKLVIIGIICAVIAVLLMIPLIVIPSALRGRSTAAREASTRGNMNAIYTALKLYELDNGTYPSTEQGLAALIEKPNIRPIPSGWAGPYLVGRPKDSWGSAYNYVFPSIHGSYDYDLWSFGPDGVESEDDIANW